MVYLVAWLQSSVALALLAQSTIALEYPLSDGHPSAATYALGHMFSSQPLRIYRLSALRDGLRCWITTFRRVRMQKARDPCEMAGLATVVTACALYIISVSYVQIELPPKLPPLGTQDWIHWYVRRSNWLAFRIEPFAICSATRLIASTQVRHVRFWLTINQRNPIVWRVARCLVERAINAQLHHQHPATTSFSNPNTR